jgi:hypothetical protein
MPDPPNTLARRHGGGPQARTLTTLKLRELMS